MTEPHADTQTSRHPDGRVRLLHLSDTHLLDGGALHYGVVDTAAALARVLDAAADVSNIDAVVLSGDLSDDGTPATYRTLQRMVEPWAAARGAAVVYVMGNHDVRAGFEEVLGERTGTVTVGGLRIVRLDSSVPGFGYGAIDDAQLDWLRRELAADAAPAVVLLHHPPTPGMTPLLAALQLRNPGPMLDICSEAGVVAILAGHFHHSLVTAERGIPLFVAPGITNTIDIHAPVGRERARIGSGFAVVDIPLGDPAAGAATRLAPRVTIHAAPGPDDGRLLFDLSDDEVSAIAAQAGAPPGSGGPTLTGNS